MFIKKNSNKEEKEEEKSGRVVLILLLSSTGLAIIFYLSSLLPSFWERISTPKVIKVDDFEAEELSPTIIVPTPTPWQKELQEELLELIGQERGVYGVYLLAAESQNAIGINHQKIFPGASLMKLPVIATAYQEAEKGRFDLTAEYRLKEEDKLVGNGSVHLQPEGTVYTYQALIQLAIEQSDNTAVSVLADNLGKEKIQALIDFSGLSRTDYLAGETTPEDIGQFLFSLHQGKMLTSSHSQEFIGFLTNTIFNDQIPSVLPENLVVAHKIGLDENLLHDAAIIFTDKGDFILVIMSQGDSQDRAQMILEEITKMIWKNIKD
ncbi:MAG: putative beta-lactamase [Microgenomates bacterium 39_6]|nr:MAG: putative beta-lactamase [Microgenomates bacterium 39_6]